MFLTPGPGAVFRRHLLSREPRYGMPAFKDLLQRVAGFYRERREDIASQNARWSTSCSVPSPQSASGRGGCRRLPPGPARAGAGEQLRPASTAASAPAPKFPHPGQPRTSAACTARAPPKHADHGALDMARITLARMAEGGIYDQLGGGFCRYSRGRSAG